LIALSRNSHASERGSNVTATADSGVSGSEGRRRSWKARPCTVPIWCRAAESR
jgi:hypothetical protein